MTPKLTDKEQALLDSVKKGMDYPGSGWLHELIPAGMTKHQVAGILGSLIEKGLVTSEEDNEGPMICFWVELVAKEANQ